MILNARGFFFFFFQRNFRQKRILCKYFSVLLSENTSRKSGSPVEDVSVLKAVRVSSCLSLDMSLSHLPIYSVSVLVVLSLTGPWVRALLIAFLTSSRLRSFPLHVPLCMRRDTGTPTRVATREPLDG